MTLVQLKLAKLLRLLNAEFVFDLRQLFSSRFSPITGIGCTSIWKLLFDGVEQSHLSPSAEGA